VLGWSTGALQIHEWAVRFAPKVKRLANIAGGSVDASDSVSFDLVLSTADRLVRA